MQCASDGGALKLRLRLPAWLRVWGTEVSNPSGPCLADASATRRKQCDFDMHSGATADAVQVKARVMQQKRSHCSTGHTRQD